jgi:hypothetical protein
MIEKTTERGICSADDVRNAMYECGYSVLYEGDGYSSDTAVFAAQSHLPA